MLGGLAVILGFLLLVTQGQRSHFRRDREKLRAEFEQYRKQMQAKVWSRVQAICRYHNDKPHASGGPWYMTDEKCTHVRLV